MSARGSKSKTPEEAALSRIPKLPPIQQFVQASSRFDNSPLLKYRRSSDVQDLLGSIVYVLFLLTCISFTLLLTGANVHHSEYSNSIVRSIVYCTGRIFINQPFPDQNLAQAKILINDRLLIAPPCRFIFPMET